MLIRSCYRKPYAKEFLLEVVGETDTDYLVRFLPEFQNEFQEGSSIHELPKYLILPDMYEIVDDTYYEQLTLF